MRLTAWLVPVLALPLAALAAGCGGGGDLPTGSWHPRGTSTGGTATGGGGTGGGGGSNAASTSSSGGGSGGGGSTSGSSGGAGDMGGGGSSGAAMGGQPANMAVTLDKTSLTMQLLDESLVKVSIAPNGYAGTVTLATGNLPSGVDAKLDNATLSLDGTTTATAMLTLHTATSTPPGSASVDVTADADGVTKRASVALLVQSAITLHIPAGVDNLGGTIDNPITTAYGPYPIQITAPPGISDNNPVTVYFKNDDSVSHEIHADAAAQGFGHDPGPFGGGQMDPYVRKVNTAGTYDFYLHDQGGPITIGRVVIQ
jgi:plastocyanin